MNQQERLDYLVEQFKEDSGTYRNLVTPADAEGKRELLRSLMNIRPPRELDPTALAVQDAYLQERNREKGLVALADIPTIAARGSNTPVIIKYPFWQMTNDNENALYACLNYNEAYCPMQIVRRSICIDGDSGEVIRLLR